MLKRQRQQSPPPSSGSIPLVPDSEELPNFKRRRTAPPLLDGVSRGWSQRDEDEEDFDLENDEDSAAPTPHAGLSGEYGATNSLLRELHTLNQHRLLFSPPPEKSYYHRLSATGHIYHHPPSLVSEVNALPISKGQTHPGHDPIGTSTIQVDPVFDGQPPVTNEMAHVMKRYEGTNRLLGELFLSRRRELGGADHSYPP